VDYICSNGITKDFWHGELRPGDTHTATGTVELLKTSFAKLPPSVKIVMIRADKGFYDHETIEYLESNKALFVIVAKLTGP
jgi:transposase